MKLRWVVLTCVFMLSAIVWVRAADDAKPADSKTEKKSTAGGRLTQPWSKMSDLSDEQKAKIKQIHAKANDEIKAIRDKETADIMALLNEDQKSEAQKLIDQQAASRKTTSARGGASASKTNTSAASSSSDSEKKETSSAGSDKDKDKNDKSKDNASK